jgi:hypothetical protein
MSTARNRFGVSILVALILGVVLAAAPQAAAPPVAGSGALGVEGGGFSAIEPLASMTSTRTQLVMALGAGVPMIIIGLMVRRRIYAEA